MTPITIATEILFGQIKPEGILPWKVAESLLFPTLEHAKIGKTPKLFQKAAHAHKRLRMNSQEEKEHAFILAVNAMEDFHVRQLNGNGEKCMLLTLLDACSRYLILRDGSAQVRFEKLLAWRLFTTEVGQDLAVCGFLACQDHHMNRERLDFGWPLHLPCDNEQLRGMLRQGMAENHYHLWGSVPSFHLLWLRLMGNGNLHEQVLVAPLAERLHPDSVEDADLPPWRLDDLSRLAAILRLALSEPIMAQDRCNTSSTIDLADLINKLLDQKGASQHELNRLTDYVNLLSETAQAGTIAGYAADYVMPPALIAQNKSEGLPLAFERYFLYKTWRRILAKSIKKEELHWFYLYLLIKAKVRREYVQVNDRIGFHNFKVYQGRKGHYTKGLASESKRFFDFWATRLAITRPLTDMSIAMLEARIAPPDNNTPAEYENTIRKCVEAAQTKLKKFLKYGNIQKIKLHQGKQPPLDIADRLYFVVHFLKGADDTDLKFASCRHEALRERLKRETNCLWTFEESGSHWSGYIRGIDAASSEIGCRPEVFAHAFRFLRLQLPTQDFILDPERQPQAKELRVTYHVGEDFLDLIDGLRAIDEAMLFLEYHRGDRLGHALALGVDAGEWYQAKQKVVMLPLQDLVDNLAWMHAHLVKIGDSKHLPLIAKLERDWSENFAKLKRREGESPYHREGESPHHFTLHQYQRAWKLRGDDPECYASGKFLSDPLQQPWQLAAIVHDSRMNLDSLRDDPPVCKLYHNYHFESSWKEAGRQIVAYDIEEGYISGATCLQHHFQKVILDMGIGIEANPSSNYLIGTFQRYDKHPLPSLHNLGLTYDQEALAANPQLHISINTDDLGIFDTSLENEYALMAVALAKMKHPDGSPRYSPAMIMDWLDRIRAMGLQQSFRSPRNGSL